MPETDPEFTFQPRGVLEDGNRFLDEGAEVFTRCGGKFAVLPDLANLFPIVADLQAIARHQQALLNFGQVSFRIFPIRPHGLENGLGMERIKMLKGLLGEPPKGLHWRHSIAPIIGEIGHQEAAFGASPVFGTGIKI